MEVYHNPRSAVQVANVAEFIAIVERYPWLKLVQPNEASPWHWQAAVKGTSGETIMLNFWPHRGKAQRDGMPSVSGISAIRSMIAVAIDDSQDDDFGAVIE